MLPIGTKLNDLDTIKYIPNMKTLHTNTIIIVYWDKIMVSVEGVSCKAEPKYFTCQSANLYKVPIILWIQLNNLTKKSKW